MNIVIVGAGDVGLYIAALLSKQKHNVILIDKDRAKLEELTWQMDIAIQEGSGTDWELLERLLELKPELFLALTNVDETNLVACSMAKNLGYGRTIARVTGGSLLNRSRLDFAQIFNVDYFISPELLLANDIYKYIVNPGSLSFENFANGEVQMRTLQIPSSWEQHRKTISEFRFPKGIMIGLIYREVTDQDPLLIFPHGTDSILPGDEVTIIGESKQMSEIHRFFGIESRHVEKVAIVGGSLAGVHLAKILVDRHIQVTLIEKDPNRCKELAKELPDCRIFQQDGTDLDFLLSERIERSNYFVMCTSNDELNILGALLAKDLGCGNVAIILNNNRFLPLLHHLGIIHVVSPKHSVANRVIALTTSKSITSLFSLYENEAEILEIAVTNDSQIVGIPLSEVGALLPKEFLIAMIQNKGSISIANGNSVINPGDTLVVICNPKYFQELKNIF